MTNEEVELKWVLPDEQAARALLEALGIDRVAPPVLQVNHFFDSEDRVLLREALAFRLREEEARNLVTLKGEGRASGSSALTVRPEEEAVVPGELARAVLAGERDVLDLLEPLAGTSLAKSVRAHLQGGSVIEIGAFRNERSRIGPLALVEGVPQVVLELDRTTFPGGRVDRELEVEVPREHATAIEQRLRDLAARIGVPWTTAPSKAKRFFAILEERS